MSGRWWRKYARSKDVGTERSAYDRIAAAGKIPPENQVWLKNPSSALVAQQLGIEPVEVGADFHEFRIALFKRN